MQTHTNICRSKEPVTECSEAAVLAAATQATFSAKLAALKAAWKAAAAVCASYGDQLEELDVQRPDLAAAAQGNTAELLQFAWIIVMLFGKFRIDALTAAVEMLSSDAKLQFELLMEQVFFLGLKDLLLNNLSLQTFAEPNEAIPDAASIVLENASEVPSPIAAFDACASMKKDDLCEENVLLAAEVRKLKAYNATIEQTAQNQRDICASLEESNAKLTRDFQTATSKLNQQAEEANRRQCTLQNELLAASAKITALEAQLKTTSVSCTASRSNFESEIDPEILSSQLAALSSENTQLKQAAIEIQDLQLQIKTLNDTNESLHEQLQAAEERFTDKIQRLQAEIDRLVNENAQLAASSEETQNLRKMLHDAEERLSARENQTAASLHGENTPSSPGANSAKILELQVQQLQNERSATTRELQQLRTAHAAAQETLHTQQQTADGLRSELDALRAVVASLRQQSDVGLAVASLQTALAEKDAEIGRLGRAIASFKASVKAEQRLVMSAWYDVGVEAQRSVASAAKNIAKEATHAPSSPAVSWLQFQRSKVDAMLLACDK